MRYTFFLILLFSLSGALSAQEARYDYNWPFGYAPTEPGHPEYNGTLLNFNEQPVKKEYFDIPFELYASAAISDSLGHLLFYSNGCKVINAKHQTMENGDKINKGGRMYEQHCEVRFGYPGFQSLLILPFPGHFKQYIMLQLHRPDDDALNKEVLYTVVDMALDSGRGAVILKNELAYQEDTLMDMLTAVRHANGRDWWVIVPKGSSREYLVSLLDDRGIHSPVVQTLDAVSMHSYPVQAVFSPNGKKYITMDLFGHLQVFDFNRCSGLLSHPRHVSFASDSVFYACGVAVSPSSRYLYVSTGTKLYQFDLAAPDLAASRQFIAYWDGHVDYQVLATTLFQQMLAPDGQIYMICTNGSKSLHVIHQPDRPGTACDFEQRAVEMFTFNLSLPNFPHFRLFDMPGSPCDTLGIDGPQPPEDTLVVVPPPSCGERIAVYPNPAALQANLELPACQAGTVTVYDVGGRRLKQQVWAEATETVSLDVSRFVPGLYFLHIQLADGERVSRSLAVMR